MKILNTVEELLNTRTEWKTLSSGFVPTMGALHEGHVSLLKQARRESEKVILSIFVNPTQFNSNSDFNQYPKTFEKDSKMAEKAGVDYIFAPLNPKELYPDDFHYRVIENDFSKKLCGAFRPGHFEGVLTVVLKLLNLVAPTRAYFGEKDFQQLELIRGMVRAFFIDTEIVACPTIREKTGLAMSSRNSRLNETELRHAEKIYEALISYSDVKKAKEALEKEKFKVEYLEDFGCRRLAAAWLGEVRLIDNVQIEK